MVIKFMQIQLSVLRSRYVLVLACHWPQGGPEVGLHRERHRVNQRDCMLGGEVEGRGVLGTKQERRLPCRDGAFRGAWGPSNGMERREREWRDTGDRCTATTRAHLTLGSCPFLCRSFCTMFSSSCLFTSCSYLDLE